LKNQKRKIFKIKTIKQNQDPDFEEEEREKIDLLTEKNVGKFQFQLFYSLQSPSHHPIMKFFF